jgi:hypothetical protein
MRKPIERPLTVGCCLAVMFLVLAAWGRWSEHRGLRLESATGRGLSLSSAPDGGARRAISGFERDSNLPGFYLDIFDDDECEDDFELRLVLVEMRQLALSQTRSLGRSDADHTTLARGRSARMSILRC